MNDIGIRAKKVLHAVVSEYLATGDAVGSHTVAKRYGLDISPATVRSVMSDLEDEGLLRHAHTSAGRIPKICSPSSVLTVQRCVARLSE